MSKARSVRDFWMNYYRTHDEDPADVREKLTLLNVQKKTQDVQAILEAYLTHRVKNAEPWMYEALAIAYKMNNESDQKVKTAFGYGADLAVRSGNPNHLVSVADLLFYHGYYDRVGTLLDQAAEKVPHRAEPAMMMVNLAQKTKDPLRMASAIDRLLSLGWPGVDERIRRDARQQAELLAKTLREEGRAPEAETLLARVTESEARDLFVRLTWVGDAGLSLAVKEPLGATARWPTTPRTVFGGSIVKDGYGNHPESVYVCPRGFDGKYTIGVETVYNNPEKPALEATLEVITHEGTPEEHKEVRKIRLNKTPDPVVVELKGGRRKTVMPFLAPQAARPPAPPAKEKTKEERKASKDETPRKDARPAAAAKGAGAGGAAVRERPR